MPEFRVTQTIERAKGTREYLIEAENERDALECVMSGHQGELDEEYWTNIEYGDIEVEQED